MERQVEPSQREDQRGEQQTPRGEVLAHYQGKNKAQSAIEDEIQRKTGQGFDPEPCAYGVVAVEKRGEEILVVPEASAVPGRNDSEPRQHAERAQHARLEARQTGGKCARGAPGRRRFFVSSFGSRPGGRRFRGIVHKFSLSCREA